MQVLAELESAEERSPRLPLLDADEPLPALGQTRTLPDSTNDQPFVPKFVLGTSACT